MTPDPAPTATPARPGPTPVARGPRSEPAVRPEGSPAPGPERAARWPWAATWLGLTLLLRTFLLGVVGPYPRSLTVPPVHDFLVSELELEVARTVDLDVRLAEGQYALLVRGPGPAGPFDVVRLSAHPRFPTGAFTADASGDAMVPAGAELPAGVVERAARSGARFEVDRSFWEGSRHRAIVPQADRPSFAAPDVVRVHGDPLGAGVLAGVASALLLVGGLGLQRRRHGPAHVGAVRALVLLPFLAFVLLFVGSLPVTMRPVPAGLCLLGYACAAFRPRPRRVGPLGVLGMLGALALAALLWTWLGVVATSAGRTEPVLEAARERLAHARLADASPLVVAVVGGSSVRGDPFGEGFRESDTWAALLERALWRDAMPRSLVVLNLGASGTTSSFGRRVVDALVAEVHVDVLVVGYVQNDWIQAATGGWARALARRLGLASATDPTATYEANLRAMAEAVRSQAPPGATAPAQEPSEASEPAHGDRSAPTDRPVRTGGEVVFVEEPHFSTYLHGANPEDGLLADFYARMARLAADTGARLVRGNAPLIAHRADGMPPFVDPGVHLNRWGHVRVAGAVAEVLAPLVRAPTPRPRVEPGTGPGTSRATPGPDRSRDEGERVCDRVGDRRRS